MYAMLSVVETIDPERLFGGIVLIALLALILTGKLRLEREVKEKDEIIRLKDKTIKEQSSAIQTLTAQAEVTNTLLREVRDMAFGDDDNSLFHREAP